MEISTRLHTKKCFVLLERLDKKSMQKCLQKHGLKLATQRNAERQKIYSRNNCPKHSRSKKQKATRKKFDISPDRNRKRKWRKIKPLYYSDEESCNESSEIPTNFNNESLVPSELEDDSAFLNKIEKSDPDAVMCDKIQLQTLECTTVSSDSEVRKQLAEDEEKSESQLKKPEIFTIVDSDVEIIKVCEKQVDREQSTTYNKKGQLIDVIGCDKSQLQTPACTMVSSKSEVRKQLAEDEEKGASQLKKPEVFSIVDTDVDVIKVCEKPLLITATYNNELIIGRESNTQQGLADHDYDSREDGEDERETVIFGKKDTDLEDVFEFVEGKMSKKFNNREILYWKRQRLVKFKKKSIVGRKLGKVERKPKNKIVVGSGNGKDTSEKPSECISEECLKKVCAMVKRLHELRIISQGDQFNREMTKGQKTIIECYEKMLKFYSGTDQVALEIGKRTSLNVDDVVNVIAFCLLKEGHYEVEKFQNVGKHGFPTGSPSNASQETISDNLVKVKKRTVSQKEAVSGTPKQPKVSTSFAVPEHEAFNSSGFLPSQCNGAKKQEINNSTNFPPSISDVMSKQQNITKNHGFAQSQQKQQILTNSACFPASKFNNQQKRKEVNSVGFFLSQPDIQPSQQSLNNSTGFLQSQSNIQHKHPTVRPSFKHFNSQLKQQTVTSTDFPPPEFNIHKKRETVNLSTANRPVSEPSSCSVNDLHKKITSQADSTWDVSTQQSVKSSIDFPVWQSKNPSGGLNRNPVFINHSFSRTFKPPAKEITVHSADYQIVPSEVPNRNIKIPKRHKQHSRPQQNSFLRSVRKNYGSTIMNPLLPNKVIPQRNQLAGYMVRGGMELSQAFAQRLNHAVGAFRQRNTVSYANLIPLTVSESDQSQNHLSSSKRNSTAGVAGNLQNREFSSVNTSNRGSGNFIKRINLRNKCPLNDANFLISPSLDNSRMFRNHVELSGETRGAMIRADGSETAAELQVLDPTIPQKLTMKNSRLQAGPILGIIDTKNTIRPSKESKTDCNESGNHCDREKSQSRVYFCAKDDCKNPGVRICNRCHSIIYCSATCQFKHWVTKHKAECYQLRALRG